MSALLLAPHNDDEALFASYLILLHRPSVFVCFKSHIQDVEHGISAVLREAETARALTWLGKPKWSQGQILDTAEDPRTKMVESIAAAAHRVESTDGAIDLVIAPAYETGGHPQHNLISELAFEMFNGTKMFFYTTYNTWAEGGPKRTVSDFKVPTHPDWVFRKLRALSCYRSQARTPSFKHFLEPLDEYVVP